MLQLSKFYFVSDSSLSRQGIKKDIQDALAAGVTIIQYREKSIDTITMLQDALDIKELCKGKATLIINDRLDIAQAVDADGVHLGQEDMPLDIARKLLPNKIVGVTVHDVEEAIKAEEGGADYVGLSPIFETQTKDDAGAPCGTQMIKKVKEAIKIPVVVIGGITKENAAECIKNGADSIVAISAVIKNPKENIEEFMKIMGEDRCNQKD